MRRDLDLGLELMDDGALEPAVLRLAAALRARGWRLATAESCTGGLVAAACTSVAGSSDWFDRGCVTYSNAAKTELLGVPAALIAQHGAVSEAVARAMAAGLLARAPVQLVAAVTGIAGPGGGTPDKPVGTVWVAWGTRAALHAERLQLAGDRAAVRGETVARVLDQLAKAAEDAPDLLAPAAAGQGEGEGAPRPSPGRPRRAKGPAPRQA